MPPVAKSPNFATAVKYGAGCPKDMIHVDKLRRTPGKRQQTYFYLQSKKREKSHQELRQEQVVVDDYGKNFQL